MPQQIRQITGLGAIADDFDGFVIDQWGVLHDGRAPYAGVPDALRQLAEAGKRALVLSNSGKRSAANRKRMVEGIGFDDSLLPPLLTSGELAWEGLSEGFPGIIKNENKSLYLIAQKGEFGAVDGSGWAVVEDMVEASLILVAGVEHGAMIDDFAPALKAGLARNLPLICSNPDFDALLGTKTMLGPGRLAAWYEAEGGQVIRVGKPEPAAFEAARTKLGLGMEARVLMIGDSLHHDIAGASRAGFRTLFIRGGIHKAILAEQAGALEALCQRVGAVPDFMLPELCW
jgi:HAD superfamily hydrolase (TIGR01459 family)